MTRDAAALELRMQGARIGRRHVLQAMELQLPAAHWSAVVGPNGAGKSTLLRVLAGLLPCVGVVTLDGRPLADWGARERARTLAWMGQGEGEAADLTVLDAVMLGRLPHQRWLAPPAPVDHRAVEHALRAMHAWALRWRRLDELSGGERQRVLLARLFAVQARVLLMDEPLAHLDPPHQALWLAEVRRLVAAGVTVVSVLHELTMALQADDLLLIDAGRLVWQGGCSDGATHRALERAFAGQVRVVAAAGRWVALPAID